MMNLVRKISIVMWMISLLTFAAAFPVSAAELIRVVGSDSMAHTVTVYATEFATNHPDCTVLVSGGETGAGWERIVSGEAEIAMLSEHPSKRQLDEAKAKGANIEEAIVGWGGIVFITHPSNPVESLTVDQVSKLLTGQYNNWQQVGGPEKPVQVITASEQVRAGTAHFILEEVTKGSLAPSAAPTCLFSLSSTHRCGNRGLTGSDSHEKSRAVDRAESGEENQSHLHQEGRTIARDCAEQRKH